MKRLVVGILVLSVWLVPGEALAQASWPMFQGNAAHTGYIPVSFDPQDFSLKWEVTLSPGEHAVNPVAAADGKVFATILQLGGEDRPDLWALDAVDGSILWSKDYGDVFSVNPPAYDNGKVYLQVGNHGSDTHLYSYNAANGVLINDGRFSAQWAFYYAPTILDYTVYINGGVDGGMYGFNFLAEYEQSWFKDLYQYDEWTPAVDGLHAYAYVGGKLSALWCESGGEDFSIIDPNFDWHGWSMHLAPVLGGRNDVLVIHDGRLVSFDLAADPPDIGFEIDDDFGWEDYGYSGQPSVAKSVIYAINGVNLEARDQDTGALLWSWTPPERYEVRGTLIVTDAHVLLMAQDELDVMPVTVHAIDLTTHQSVWSYGVSPRGWYWDVEARLAWSEGVLYIARADGVLTALGLTEYEQSSVVQFGASSYTAAEDDGSVTVTVKRLGAADGAVGVTVQTANGSAEAGTDYTAVDQVVSWTDGDSTDKTVNVTLLNDDDIEGVETAAVKLVNPTGPTSLGAPNRALLTIYDDEIDLLRFNSSSTEVNEDVGTLTVYVRRDGPATGEVTVDYATASGTASAGTDYAATAGTLDWDDGDTAPKPITVTILDDGIDEDDKDFAVSISDQTGNAIIGTPATYNVTIVDDDGPRIEFSAATYQVNEVDGSVMLTVGRFGGTDGAVSVDWATSDRTALAGSDYTSGSGTLEWADADESNKTILLMILDDDDTEGGENFEVTLSNVVGGETTLGQPFVASVAITDDEAEEFPIHTTIDLRQMRPRVAMNATGATVVVWESWKQDDLSGWGVYGQRMNPNGSAAGDEFLVNQTVVDDQQNAAVAMAADGSFFVVWEGATDSGVGIFGRRFDASGDPDGDEFVVNTSASGTQNDPRVAIDGAGRAAVVWTGRDGSGTGIFGRAFGPDEMPYGDEFVLNATTLNGQNTPIVAGSSSGGFFVVWESYSQDTFDSKGVFGRRIGTTGLPVGDEVAVNTVTDGDQSQPSVAAVGSSSYLVVWEDDTGLDGAFGSIQGRWYNATANPTAVPFQINSYGAGDQGRPMAAGEAAGRAVVAWEGRSNQDGSDTGVFGRVLYESGGFANDEVQFNTYVADEQYQPEVACSIAGRLTAVWTSEQQDGSGEGVYGVSWPLPPTALIFTDGFESGDTTEWSN